MLSVGRLVPRKGFDATIEAVKLARESGADISLTIVGEGPERSKLIDLARDPNGAWFRLEEGVDDDRLHELYAEADGFILMGREVDRDFEGFGLVLLEAAAHGLPIVTTNTGGVLEAVAAEGTAIVIDPTDAARWMKRLAMDSECLARMSAEAIKFARQFDWSRTVSAISDTYSHVVGLTRNRGPE